MSRDALQLADPGVECTFVAGTAVRDGHLALWRHPVPGRLERAGADGDPGRAGGADPGDRPDGDVDGFDDELDVLLVEGGAVRRRRVPCRRVALRDAIDDLVGLAADSPATASTRAWAHATRATLHLIARGRTLPTADADGTDLWRAGPLDPDDVTRWRELAAALPGPAHAGEVPGSAPRRVASPTWLLARFRDAVTDAYVRTPAAVEAAGHRPFAAGERTPVAGSARWLVATGSATDAPIVVSLRVVAGDRSDLADLAGGADDGAPDDGAPDDAGTDGDVGADGDAYAETEPSPPPAGSASGGSAAGDLRAVVQVGSRLDPSLVVDAVELWRAPQAVRDRFGTDVEDQVLLALRRAARAWPPAARLLDDPRPTELELSADEVDDLLGPTADALAGGGVEVLWPAGLLAPVRVTPTVATDGLTADRAAGLGFDGLCELRWSVTVDGAELTEDELRELADAKRQVVRLRGRWVRADPDRLRRLQASRKVSAGAALAAALGGDLLVDGEAIEAVVEGPLADLAERLRDAGERADVEVPTDLHATLRPYQHAGLSWLATMAELGFGGVLADDMGLGKTVQVLALHVHRRATRSTAGTDGTGGPTLVVCPVSVIANWEREAHRFAPLVPVRRYHGTTRDLRGLAPDEIVLTTYGVVRRETAALAEVGWGLVVADEAQQVKNPTSRAAKALRAIPASARFALTGTPVENRLVDLWALLDWTTPGLLGPLDRFRHELAVPIERDRDADAAAMLSRLVRPFVLRRRKIDPDIAPDLPPKTESDQVVGLTTEQATLYRALADEVMDQVEKAEGIARRGLVLKLLGGLKQICNHPAQYLRQSGPLAGRSGKFDAVTELIDVITDEGDSALVFTQFVTMGHLIAEHLRTPDRPVEFLHGSLSSSRRQDLVDRFQAGEIPVLVVSLKAGGTGLNLTRATHVVHFDRWWNPAVEDQASDRAWRIGQDRPVQVHRMVCEGTVEDHIAQLLVTKRDLADSVIGAGEGWIGDLDDDDLRTLVALGSEDGR